MSVTHTYSTPGSYDVLVTGSDMHGQGAHADQIVTVNVALSCPATNPFLNLKQGVEYSWEPATFKDLVIAQPFQDVVYEVYPPTTAKPAITVTSWVDIPVHANIESYCEWIMASGGTPPYTYSVNNAPPGLNIDPISGFYGGVPQKVGYYENILFTVTDSVGGVFTSHPRSQMICDDGQTACFLTPQ